VKPIVALLRGTWWLWLLFLSASVALSRLIDPLFYAMIPICLVTAVYFAFVRYDSDGQRREHR
jgi:hypothetical protein